MTAVLSACACMAMAACSPAEPAPQAPPPAPPTQAPPPPLAGGAPAPYGSGPYTGPRTGLDNGASQIVTMNPIANPEGSSERVYERHGPWHGHGLRYGHVVRTAHGHRIVKAPHGRGIGHAAPRTHPGLVVRTARPHHAAASKPPAPAVAPVPAAQPVKPTSPPPPVGAGPAVTAPIAPPPAPESSTQAAQSSSAAASDTGMSDQAAQSDQASAGLYLPSLPHFLAKLSGQTANGAPAQGGLHLSSRAVIAIFLAAMAVVILLLIQKNMADQRRDAERKTAHAAPRRPLNLDGGDPPPR